MFVVDQRFADVMSRWYDDFMKDLYQERFPIQHNNGPHHILMAAPVYGMEFLETFCSYSLPTIVAEANAQALWGRCTMAIFTDKKSKRMLIGGAHAIKKYGIELVVFEIPDYVMEEINAHFMNRFWILGIVHSLAMQLCARWQMGFHMYVPDHVYDKKYFMHMGALQNKHKVILQTGITGRIDPIRTVLDKKYRTLHNNDGRIEVDALDLSDLAMQHLHIQSQQYLMNYATFPDNIPYTQFQVWRMNDHLQIYSGFHNPVWMDYDTCARVASSSLSTLDTRMPELGIVDYYVPQVEDKMVYIEISSDAKSGLSPPAIKELWIDRAWEQLRYERKYMRFRERPAIVPLRLGLDIQPRPTTQEHVDKMQNSINELLLTEIGESAIRRVIGIKPGPELLPWSYMSLG